MTTITLSAFRRDDHWQFGEDGILECLFAEMRLDHGTFCELGAWDGTHLSNTRTLFDADGADSMSKQIRIATTRPSRVQSRACARQSAA